MRHEWIRMWLLIFMLAMGAVVTADNNMQPWHWAVGLSQMFVMAGLIAWRLRKAISI